MSNKQRLSLFSLSKKIDTQRYVYRYMYKAIMSTDQIITEPSICIPRTLNNVTWRDVKDVFEKLLGKGTVERVDIVTRRDDESPFCRIFVHMRYWPVDQPGVAAWRQTLVDGGEIKVVHNHPWFWKCRASTVAKPEKKKAVSSEPYIMAPDKVPDKPSLSSWTDEALGSGQGDQKKMVDRWADDNVGATDA